MYSVRDNIMVIELPQNINKEKLNLFVNTLASYKEVITEKKIQGITISIKFMQNQKIAKDMLPPLIRLLIPMASKMGVKIAFVDYTIPIFRLLKSLTKETSVILFKNHNVAKLFFSPKAFKKDIRILIYDEDEECVNGLGKEIAKLGYTAVRARTAKEFEEQIKVYQSDVAITQCSLNQGLVKSSVKKLSISRKLVENLPLFMDTAVETLVMLTGLDAKKSSHKIKPFSTKISEDMVVSMMSFKGDLHGNFVLMFPKEIAIDALEAMLGESVMHDSIPEILDGVKEFCNIITGSSKTKLQNKGISVIFELPKAYTSLQAIANILGDANGLWVDMELKNKSFYMFIR